MEHGIENVDIVKHKFYIIERLLEYGGDNEVAFIFENYSNDEIKNVVMKSRNLSGQTVNYWCLYFKWQREKTKCFTMRSKAVWRPY